MKKFTNDFASWQETHFEVVSYLTHTVDTPESMSNKAQEYGGRGCLYQLAEGLTNKFEGMNKDREWDGEFYDEIDAFLEEQDEKSRL